MYCEHCLEYNHDTGEERSLRGERIFLHQPDNIDRNQGRRSVIRNVYHAHKRLESRLWGQDVDQWAGFAVVRGKRVQVWGWTHRNTVPAEWQDIGE